MHAGKHISIWFFIGSLLVVYGILIFGAGISEWRSPSRTDLVLSHLHAAIWWGVLLLVIGAGYTWAFWPGRKGR